MGDIERCPESTTLSICPLCGERTIRGECAGTPTDPHPLAEGTVVEYVRADLHQGAVEALERIAKFVEGRALAYPGHLREIADMARAGIAANGGR